MNPVDQKYIETMQEKEAFRHWMSMVSMMPPDKQTAYLASKKLSLADFSAAQMQEAKQVEAGGAELNKEEKPSSTSVGVEPVDMLKDPAAILAAIFGVSGAALAGIGSGLPILSNLLYSVGFGAMAGETAGMSGAGPALQAISEFIGNLSNPEGEAKILAQHGPDVLSKIQQEMSSEANVKILQALKAGIESGEIVPTKAPMKVLSRLKGILKAPDDEALRTLKAGFVSPTTEAELFKAQSRRINRLNHLLEVMKNSGPGEQQLLHGVVADEFIKYMQLATNKVTSIDNAGKTIFRNSKIEFGQEQLDEIKKFADLTEFPTFLNRLLKPEEETKGLGEKGSSQLISDISSKLYAFGKSLLSGESGSIPQTLYEAEVHAQMLDPRITFRKLETDVSFIPWQRLMQSVSLGMKYRSFSVGERAFMSAMIAYKNAFPEAMAIMSKTLASGDPEFEKLLMEGLSKSEARKLGFQNTHYAMEGFDLSDPGMVNLFAGSWYATGSKAVMSADQFAKVIARRSGMRMLAVDHALEELTAKGIKGPKLVSLAEDQAETWMKDPPDWLIRSMNGDMYKTTFTDSGKWIAEMTQFMRNHPWSRVYFEFVRTPMNLEKEGLRHTPLGLFPGRVFGDVGLDAGVTQAKAAVGSAFCWWVYDQTLKGNITGSGPTAPAHFNMNLKPPYTMFGHSYMHLKPIGTTIAMCADAAEAMANIKDPNDKEEMKGALVKAVAQTLLNVPTMEGMVNLVSAADEASRGKTYGLEKILSQKVASFVPAPVKMAADIYDPVVRQAKTQTKLELPSSGNAVGDIFIDQAQNVIDKVINKTPIRNGMPYRKWDGEEQYLPPGVSADGTAPSSSDVAISMFNPFSEVPDPRDDLDRELERLGVEFKRPPKELRIGNDLVTIPETLQDKWAILAGGNDELTKFNGMNQRERGNSLITKPYYIDAPGGDEARKELLKSNHYLYEGKAEYLIRQELQAPPVEIEEDFPTTPVNKPQGSAPSLGE